MADLTEFEKYYGVVEALIEQSTKGQLADSTLLLSLVIAQYKSMHGDIPISGASTLLNAVDLNEEQVALLAAGMELTASVLRYVVTDVPFVKH